ncbi:MAG TPA: hypothetical protein VGQ30_09200, partial [Gemmatimonadaceae bacterium]|nr:hypothetical protein [Gemmatimonadaceae bacterium]
MNKTPRIFAVAYAAAVVAVSTPAHRAAGQTADTLARVAFTNATVIDGTGAPPAARRTILTSRGTIEDVFET